MSQWSNDEKVEAAFDLMEGSFCGDGFMRRVGGKLLDLRERAEKAEKRADDYFETILSLNQQVHRATKENTSLDTTCRELTKRLAASEQRCAALEAALASAKERCGDIFSGKVEDEALGDVVVALGAALSGDTSALRDMLERAAQGGIDAVSGDGTLFEYAEDITKRVMEGR